MKYHVTGLLILLFSVYYGTQSLHWWARSLY